MPTRDDPRARVGRRATTPAVEIFPGVVRRTIGWGDRAMVCEITLAAGSVVPPHDHPHEQCGYLVSGRLAFTIGDTTHLLEAGDGWLIPGGTTHAVEAPVASVAIDVFSPVRDEYR